MRHGERERFFRVDTIAEPQIEILGSRAAFEQVLAQPEIGQEFLPERRRAHAQHLTVAAQHDTQITARLDLHLRNLDGQIAEITEQDCGAARAVTTRLWVGRLQPANDRQVEARRVRPVDVDEDALGVHQIELLDLGERQGYPLAYLDEQAVGKRPLHGRVGDPG